jgi:hypothetical protein
MKSRRNSYEVSFFSNAGHQRCTHAVIQCDLAAYRIAITPISSGKAQLLSPDDRSKNTRDTNDRSLSTTINIIISFCTSDRVHI